MVALGTTSSLTFLSRYVHVEFASLVGDFVSVMFTISEGFARMPKCTGTGDGKPSKTLMRFVICRC